MNYYFFCYIPTGMPAHVHIIICPLVAVGDLPVCRMGVRWFGVQVARPGATGQISADAQGNVSFYFVAMFGLSSAKQKEVYYNKSQGKGWYCQHGRLGVFMFLDVVWGPSGRSGLAILLIMSLVKMQ